MVFLAITALALLGGTTWFAVAQPTPRHRILNHRLAGIGLVLCLVLGAGLVVAALT